MKTCNVIKDWLLYNVMTSFYVVYTPKRHVGGMYPQGDSYLHRDGVSWTFNVKEAKRFWDYQKTINIWTHSKKVTL